MISYNSFSFGRLRIHFGTKIDNYIRDRIIIADEVIQELAGKKIKDGDVILTYARFVNPV